MLDPMCVHTYNLMVKIQALETLVHFLCEYVSLDKLPNLSEFAFFLKDQYQLAMKIT